jgi:hypothetical protein
LSVELGGREERIRTLRELVDLCCVGVGVLAVLSEWLQRGRVPFCRPESASRGRVVGGRVVNRV